MFTPGPKKYVLTGMLTLQRNMSAPLPIILYRIIAFVGNHTCKCCHYRATNGDRRFCEWCIDVFGMPKHVKINDALYNNYLTIGGLLSALENEREEREKKKDITAVLMRV